jgi:hypothetical protein
MSYIFISYSHKDSGYAHKLAESLEERGFEVWIDERIDYGTRWPHVIQENLDRCSAFILVMTSRSYDSDWVQNELSRAKRKRKPVFPLLLEGSEPWLSVEATLYCDVRGRQLPPPDFYARLARVVPIGARVSEAAEVRQADAAVVEGMQEQLQQEYIQASADRKAEIWTYYRERWGRHIYEEPLVAKALREHRTETDAAAAERTRKQLQQEYIEASADRKVEIWTYYRERWGRHIYEEPLVAKAIRDRKMASRLEGMTMSDLRDKAKKQGISGYSRLRKNDLILRLVRTRAEQ